ncbi:MAG: hypothetical protein ACMG6S_12055 [Byssovorax sp.]
MPSFVVDPILCTTPEIDAAPSEVARWLAALEAWLVALEGSPFAWRHFLGCTEALVEIGRFASFDRVRAAVKRAEVDVNVGKLLQRISRFFQDEARDLQAITAAKCAVVAEVEPTIAPPELLTRNLPEARGALRDGLLCLACDKMAGEAFAKDSRLVTSPFADGVKEVSVAGTVELTDPESMMARLSSQALRASFPSLFSPGDLFAFNREALLAGGEGGFCALVRTIALASYPGSQPLASSLGSQLWKSLEKSGILEDALATGKLLRICSATLADRLEELNVGRRPKRETDAADSAQQTRGSDKAKAWRLTITKAGAGYRLHYWHVPARGDEQAEQIEFANVLRETDPVVIPER